MPHGKQKELMTGGLYLIYETCLDIRAVVAHIGIAYGHFHLLLQKKLRLHFELSFYALLLKQQDVFFSFHSFKVGLDLQTALFTELENASICKQAVNPKAR